MALTSDQQQLVNEVGETPDGRLAAAVPALQAVWATKDVIRPGLARLYTKLQLIQTKQGYVTDRTNYQQLGVLSQSESDLLAHANDLYGQTLAEIRRLESKARSRRSGDTYELSRATPGTPPWPSPPFPDANDPRFRGDPYVRSITGREVGLP